MFENTVRSCVFPGAGIPGPKSPEDFQNAWIKKGGNSSYLEFLKEQRRILLEECRGEERIVMTHEVSPIHLDTVYLPAAGNHDAGPTVVLFPGNAMQLEDLIETARAYQNTGLNVMLFNPRYYGGSYRYDEEGKREAPITPTELGMYRDARTICEYLMKEKRVAPENMVLHGISMGAAVAAAVLRQYPAMHYIAQDTFSSLETAAKKMISLVPDCAISWAIKGAFPPEHKGVGEAETTDTLATTNKLRIVGEKGASGQALFLAAKVDEVIHEPVSHAKRLFKARYGYAPASDEQRLITRRASHGECVFHDKKAGGAVFAFLRTLGLIS